MMKRIGKKKFLSKISLEKIVNKHLKKYFSKKILEFFFLICFSRKGLDLAKTSDVFAKKIRQSRAK